MEGKQHKFQWLDGSWMKIIAMISMLIDHVAGYFFSHFTWAQEPLFEIGNQDINWMFIFRRVIGRLAFPLFCFLLVEGFSHTRNVKRYVQVMLGWAIITQPCFNLVKDLPWYVVGHGLNVLFTLFVGLLALIVYENEKFSNKKKTCLCLVIMMAAYLGHMDYGAMGVSFILLTHVLKNRMELELAAVLGCFLKRYPFAGISWILMVMYNGKRGFIHGTISKYLCYAFYPLHMLAIYLLRMLY